MTAIQRAQPMILLVAFARLSLAEADERTGKLEVVSPKGNGIIATALNNRGDVVGFEWVEEKERPGVVGQEPFFARGKTITYLPRLEGYTATFPADVSDDGVVVGRASKPAPPGALVPLRNQAFLWDSKTGMRGLGVLEGDSASFACGIARDGQRISGYSVGPNRVRACVWDREGDGWKATALPQAAPLRSYVVPISDDGRSVAAVDGKAPCLWKRDDSGRWTREEIGELGSLVPRDVNNAGTVVGLLYKDDGTTHAVLWSRREGYRRIPEPAGFVRSEANAVNNQGVVAGMIDGPNGSKIGPNAFVFENGSLRIVDEGGPGFTAATAINDRGQVAGVLEEKEEDEKKGQD